MGGGEHDVYWLARGLAEQGHEVHVLTAHLRHSNVSVADPAELLVHEKKDRIFIHRILGIKALRGPSILDLSDLSSEELFHTYSSLAIMNFITAEKPDVINALNVHSVLASVASAKVCRVPVVGTINSFGKTCPKGDRIDSEKEVCTKSVSPKACFSCYYHCGHAFGKGRLDKVRFLSPVMFVRDFMICSMFRAALNMCDSVIATSSSVRNVLVEFGVSAKKIEVIPPIIDLMLFKPRNDRIRIRKEIGFDSEDSVVLCAAHVFDSSKGSDFLIDAMPLVLETIPMAKFLIVGNVPPRELALLKDKNLSEHVLLMGSVPIQRLAEIYEAADVVVWLERRGIGRVLIEAMSMKKPVVASRVRQIMDVVDSGKNGLLVNPKDMNELAGAIVRILGNKELAKKLGEAAKITVGSKFAEKTVIQETVEAYTHVLDSKP